MAIRIPCGARHRPARWAGKGTDCHVGLRPPRNDSFFGTLEWCLGTAFFRDPEAEGGSQQIQDQVVHLAEAPEGEQLT